MYDRPIVEQGLSLWISMIAYNNDLMEDLYKNPAICEIIIERGLLVNDSKVRSLFMDALVFICKNVKSGTLSEQPTFFILKRLLAN